MRNTLKLSVYVFMFGVALFIFGGTNILFQAESQSVETVSSIFKISSIIGIAMIAVSLILFIIVTAISGPENK